MTHNEEENQLTETNPDLTKMLKLEIRTLRQL